jgi:hypothetical protein
VPNATFETTKLLEVGIRGQLTGIALREDLWVILFISVRSILAVGRFMLAHDPAEHIVVVGLVTSPHPLPSRGIRSSRRHAELTGNLPCAVIEVSTFPFCHDGGREARHIGSRAFPASASCDDLAAVRNFTYDSS